MAVIEYLRSCGLVSRIGLWGRSMGAATSILVAARDPSIAGMVLDSSFSNLTQVSTHAAPHLARPAPARTHARSIALERCSKLKGMISLGRGGR